MFDKNYIFIIASIFLGILISFYYNRDLNIKFLYYFIIISISLYIIFYLLGRSNTEEAFADYYSNNKFINNKFYNVDGKFINEEQHIRDSLDDEDHLIHQGGTHIPQEEHHIQQEEHHIPQEEHLMHHIPQEEHHVPQEENLMHHVPQEENITYPPSQRDILSSPDISRYTLPNSGISGPLNINISYNAQNSMNELTESKSKPNHKSEIISEQSRNIGNIDYIDSSRIYNNSDWIYGTHAWTNEPDYYIPQKDLVNSGPIQSLMNPGSIQNLLNSKPVQNIMKMPIKDLINSKPVQNIINTPIKDLINSKPVQNLINSRLSNPRTTGTTGPVAPLMINTPWSEYKSGDSEPEPFNL